METKLDNTNTDVSSKIYKTKRPTIKQQRAFNIMNEKLVNGGRDLKKSIILREAGYSEAIVKNPDRVFNSLYFQEALAQIDDRMILNKIEEIALSEDKRTALEGCKEIMKLKSRYPATTLRINDFKDELNDVFE